MDRGPRPILEAEPRVHAAAIAFLSDFYSHWAPEWRMGRNFAYDRFTSLDHAVWVHRFVHWDDWWLLRHAPRSAQGPAESSP